MVGFKHADSLARMYVCKEYVLITTDTITYLEKAMKMKESSVYQRNDKINSKGGNNVGTPNFKTYQK